MVKEKIEFITYQLNNIYNIIGKNLLIKILLTIIFILLIWLIRFIIIKIVWRRTDQVKLRYNWKKSTGYISVILILLITGIIWIKGFNTITTLLGLVAVGLVVVLKEPIMDIIGWILIISRRHIEVGDRIQIGENKGDVIDINIFYFTLMEIGNWVNADQSTGRIIHIPNHNIYFNTLANYTKGLEFLWNEIPVIITFESDWEKCKTILTKIINNYAKKQSHIAEEKVKKAAHRFLINYSKFTPIVYTNVMSYGINLTIRYLCEPRKRRQTECELWEIILKEFEKYENIDFAYPTQRFYNHLNENKKI